MRHVVVVLLVIVLSIQPVQRYALTADRRALSVHVGSFVDAYGAIATAREARLPIDNEEVLAMG
ncbi:hypothetical protein [Paraburkholderia fungorum]|uniref:Uncharacterized protein n=1 Tax=Paraburkholderia fungorum TaxID=134537 RepID=A0A3R7EPT3_9BURK|nr:hypothetical protein [Paraburkholderia fungorum]RKF36698.1 hypothetical protein BCY88_35265 [Paraburkholderia fungorum]